MPIYRSNGVMPQKHLTLVKGPHGKYCHEELMTNEGFSGETSLLYRLRPPTSMLGSEQLAALEVKAPDSTPLQNYLFYVDRIHSEGDFLTARRTLFFGDNVSFSMGRPTRPTDGFYRNGWSDELFVITEGSGILRSAFGDLRYRDLDLVHVPRSVTVQRVPDDVPHLVSVVESTSPIRTPPHFRSPAKG